MGIVAGADNWAKKTKDRSMMGSLPLFLVHLSTLFPYFSPFLSLIFQILDLHVSFETSKLCLPPKSLAPQGAILVLLFFSLFTSDPQCFKGKEGRWWWVIFQENIFSSKFPLFLTQSCPGVTVFVQKWKNSRYCPSLYQQPPLICR